MNVRLGKYDYTTIAYTSFLFSLIFYCSHLICTPFFLVTSLKNFPFFLELLLVFSHISFISGFIFLILHISKIVKNQLFGFLGGIACSLLIVQFLETLLGVLNEYVGGNYHRFSSLIFDWNTLIQMVPTINLFLFMIMLVLYFIETKKTSLVFHGFWVSAIIPFIFNSQLGNEIRAGYYGNYFHLVSIIIQAPTIIWTIYFRNELKQQENFKNDFLDETSN